MKGINQKTFLGVLILGVVVLLLVYFMVFQKYNDKTESLKAENTTLRGEVQIAKKYYDEMETNQRRIDEIRSYLNEMLDEYPADAREEDAIMMGVDMEAMCGEDFQYKEINIAESEVLYTIPEEEVVTAGIEELTNTIEFVERNVTYSGKLDYSDLKKCIQQIYSNPNRIGIYNVAIAKQETATDDGVSSHLEGNIDVSFYSVTGTNKTYVAPDIAEYEDGTSNPFKLARLGSVAAPVQEPVQE